MSDPVATINDMRLRIIRSQELSRTGQPVPDGLVPSAEEMREALLALRQERASASTRASSKRKAAAPLPTDLNDLFKS